MTAAAAAAAAEQCNSPPEDDRHAGCERSVTDDLKRVEGCRVSQRDKSAGGRWSLM